MPATKCRRCFECQTSNHHWLPVCDPHREDVDAECKHCDQEARECRTCQGTGEGLLDDDLCGDCDGEGYIPLS